VSGCDALRSQLRWLAVPQATEGQRIGNQIDAAMSPPVELKEGDAKQPQANKRQRGKVKRSFLWMTSFSVILFLPFLSSF
jgi:hypothetical protein